MKQIVVTLFLLLSVFVLWRYTYIFPCMPSHFYCVSDSLFSVKSVSFFNEQLMRCAQKKKSLNDTIGEVKTACPFIKDISIAYRPHGGVVQFFSYEPLCVINNIFVLTHAGLFEKSFFSAHAMSIVPYFSVTHDMIQRVPGLVSPLLMTGTQKIYTTYDIHCENDNTIIFTDKKDSFFSIVIRGNQDISTTLFDLCDQVKEQIMMQKDVKKHNWKADARFADYIIAYRT